MTNVKKPYCEARPSASEPEDTAAMAEVSVLRTNEQTGARRLFQLIAVLLILQISPQTFIISLSRVQFGIWRTARPKSERLFTFRFVRDGCSARVNLARVLQYLMQIRRANV